MFRGRVSTRLAPLVPLDLIASDGQTRTVEVFLDTGFEGSLYLPGDVIRQLALPLYDEFVLTLADGSRIKVLGYEGQVMLHDRRRSVLVLESQGEALLGMNLLWRNRITIDNYANGPVVIEEL